MTPIQRMLMNILINQVTITRQTAAYLFSGLDMEKDEDRKIHEALMSLHKVYLEKLETVHALFSAIKDT
jgi:membrane carboxypeptidase/penicillin-binding protein